MRDSVAVRQCYLNCIAVFKYYGLPVTYAIAMQSDRTMFEYKLAFMEHMQKLVPGKFETWPFNRNHGTTAKRGWRERVAMYSMQIVEHEYGVLEVDFDVFNPNHGVAPMFCHLGEVLRHRLFRRKTNPFIIAKCLRKRGIEASDAIWEQIKLDAGGAATNGT